MDPCPSGTFKAKNRRKDVGRHLPPSAYTIDGFLSRYTGFFVVVFVVF